MMVSDEEKRWLVAGIAMNKVTVPVLRHFINQGMDTHYANNTYCSGLTAPCTLKTLTYHQVNTDPMLKKFKFQNINNNLDLYGNRKNRYRYNYNINSSVDLAKLYLPDYLAKFSSFDESLDMSAILRLLGCTYPAPIFHSPNPLMSIQTSADDVRDNVRNKWGHCNVTDWTEVLFNDCFSKLETLVRSLGLTGGMEKTILDQLCDWKTKGCQLCMGHAVDQTLLSLVQQDVKELVDKYMKIEAEQSAIQESLDQQRTEQIEMQNTVASLQDQQSSTRVHLEEHDEQLEAVMELMKENKGILETLVSVEKTLSEELLIQVQDVESHISQTDERVKQLEENARDQKMKDKRAEASPMEPFDVKTCRSKLAEHYKRTAKVPTSVWSKTSPVDIHQIYTRLSLVKEEQTPAGSSQSKLTHYTDVLTPNKNGDVPKRILVQGQTGIGKSTFVKKLAVDWAELDDEKMEVKQGDALERFENDPDVSENNEETSQDYENTASDDEDTSSDEFEENQKNALKKFELVLVINLKEVSKCQSLKDVVSRCDIFPEEETALTEGLLSYIAKNQEKVLLVFDGYDEYRCGSNSEIYEIFRGKKLRNCCVLITTRISKADELREFKDVHAEITGFSRMDRKAFMKRMLGGETEAEELRRLLSREDLQDLARVPLLILFFCTLWKNGKLKCFPESKTKLYLAIVQHVLDYNQGKHSPARFGEVQDFKEILAEIGKVALECLLKDDHVFEYNQLPAAILCEESLIIGLLQVTEYAENLRPAGMVSFIHKSLQEFLAAWYITYKCVPEGNLGGIEEHVLTLDDGETWENVFQFICGLSNDGAVKVLEHLTSVRISDPTLDLSQTIPDVENETDVPLCDVTDEQWRFSNLVYNFFQEVHCKAEFLRHCFDCTGGFVLVTKRLTKLLQKVKAKDVTQDTHSGVFFYVEQTFNLSVFDNNPREKADSMLDDLIEVLDCQNVPLRITKSSEVLTVGDFLRKFKVNIGFRPCISKSILCFRNGQFQFYITELNLFCDDHTRLFTETTDICVQSLSANLCSEHEQSCLKFLTSLQCYRLSDQTGKALGGVIRNCKHLNSVKVQGSGDSVCDLLDQVVNPSKCSLEIGLNILSGRCALTSAGAVKLARLLPRFNNIIYLYLNLSDCCTATVDTLVPNITHKTLRRLELSGISLTPAAVAALGRSLPEMSSLQALKLTRVDGSIVQAEEMGALFGGFNKTLPLCNLTFSGFSVSGCLAPLTKSLRFFPYLRELDLDKLNMDERDLRGLLESLRFIPNLEILRLDCTPLSHAHCCTAEVNTAAGFTHKTLRRLELSGISLNPAVVAALGRSLPEMPSLQTLMLTKMDGSILQGEEMGALFGGFNKTLPLCNLTFSGFSVSGCLAPLTKSLRFFPYLRELYLEELNTDEHNLCHLLESLRFTPNLKILVVQGKPLSHAHCCTAEVNAAAGFTHKTLKELVLSGISLTPAVAATLGRSLPEMSSLQTLKLTGANGSIFPGDEMEALFGGFNKTLPLCNLTFSGFSVISCLAPLTKSLRFFPNLRELYLEELNTDEHNLCHLLESLRFIPNLEILSVEGKPLSRAHCCTAEVNTAAGFTHKTLERLVLSGISLTPAVAAALGRSLPEMSSLKTLRLTGASGCSVHAEEMEALFGGFDKTLPLCNLTFSGFSARGCLAPLTNSLHFFPDLIWLHLDKLNMDEHDLRGLLESLRFIPNLETLNLSGNPLGHAVTSIVLHVNKVPKLYCLDIKQTGSEEELNCVRETIKQAKPKPHVSFILTGFQ